MAVTENLIYENPIQLKVMNWRPRKCFVEAGRATGKSSLVSDFEYGIVTSIPRGTSFLLGNSMRQLLGITAPTMLKELTSKWHWVPGIHYWPSGKAPSKAGFDEPVYTPKTWANAIHWRNGSVTALISAASDSCGNGYSFVGGITEEAKFVNPDVYTKSVINAIRGSVQDHPGWRRGVAGDYSRPGNPYYGSEWSVSDKAVSVNQAKWSNYMRGQANTDEMLEVRSKLARCIADLEIAEKCGVVDKLLATPTFLPMLNDLRCQATVAFNFSTIENLAILAGGGDPEDYLKNLQRSMHPVLFGITVLGLDITQKTVDSYYKNFDEDVHTYITNDDDTEQALRKGYTKKFKARKDNGTVLDGESIDNEALSEINDTCVLDTDLDQDAPLILGYDYNHAINTLVVAQYRERFMNYGASLPILSTLYNMDENRLEGLCEQFCRKYCYKVHKDAVIVIDSTAKQGGSYASKFGEDMRFYNIIKRVLKSHGWNAEVYDIGQPMRHELKYEFVNQCFAGLKGFMPLINRTSNDVLIASIQNSKMYYDMDGKPRKDKRLEKNAAHSDDEKLRLAATDVTDALDSILIATVKSQGRFAGKSGSWGNSKSHRLTTSNNVSRTPKSGGLETFTPQQIAQLKQILNMK